MKLIFKKSYFLGFCLIFSTDNANSSKTAEAKKYFDDLAIQLAKTKLYNQAKDSSLVEIINDLNILNSSLLKINLEKNSLKNVLKILISNSTKNNQKIVNYLNLITSISNKTSFVIPLLEQIMLHSSLTQKISTQKINALFKKMPETNFDNINQQVSLILKLINSLEESSLEKSKNLESAISIIYNFQQSAKDGDDNFSALLNKLGQKCALISQLMDRIVLSQGTTKEQAQNLSSKIATMTAIIATAKATQNSFSTKITKSFDNHSEIIKSLVNKAVEIDRIVSDVLTVIYEKDTQIQNLLSGIQNAKENLLTTDKNSSDFFNSAQESITKISRKLEAAFNLIQNIVNQQENLQIKLGSKDQEKNNLQNQNNDLKQKLQELQSQLEEMKNNLDQSNASLAETQTSLESEQSSKSDIQNRFDQAKNELNKKDEQLKNLQTQLDKISQNAQAISSDNQALKQALQNSEQQKQQLLFAMNQMRSDFDRYIQTMMLKSNSSDADAAKAVQQQMQALQQEIQRMKDNDDLRRDMQLQSLRDTTSLTQQITQAQINQNQQLNQAQINQNQQLNQAQFMTQAQMNQSQALNQAQALDQAQFLNQAQFRTTDLINEQNKQPIDIKINQENNTPAQAYQGGASSSGTPAAAPVININNKNESSQSDDDIEDNDTYSNQTSQSTSTEDLNDDDFWRRFEQRLIRLQSRVDQVQNKYDSRGIAPSSTQPQTNTFQNSVADKKQNFAQRF